MGCRSIAPHYARGAGRHRVWPPKAAGPGSVLPAASRWGGPPRTQPRGAVGEPLFYGRGGICKSSPIRVSSSGSLCLADPSPTDLEAGSLGKPVELDVPSSCQTPFP